MKMKTFLSRLAAAALIVCGAILTTSCSKTDRAADAKKLNEEKISQAISGKGEMLLGISIPSADHGWTGGIVSWAEQAKKDIESQNPNVKVIISTAKSSEEQVKGVENLMMSNINALVILPHQPEALTAVCKRVAKNGIRLVVVDRGLTEPVYDLEVIGDNYGFGVACGKAIAAELGGKGGIVIMEGIPCQVNSDRVKGFEDVMKNYPDIKILQKGCANWSEEEGLHLMENTLAKHPAIDAVWTGDDDVLRGALKAYEKSKRTDVKLMVGGGGSKDIVKKVMDKDPLVRLTVTYPPKMIYIAAQEAIKPELPKEKRMVVPADTVNYENAKDFYYPDSRY